MEKDTYRILAQKYPDNILEPFDTIYRKYGFEVLHDIIEWFGKTNLYIPSAKTIFGDCITEQVITEYNGVNVRELSIRYEFCEATVKRMVGRKRE